MVQLLRSRQWKGASRIVFYLTVVGNALLVEGARPRVMEDSNLDVDHSHTEIPFETKGSTLDVSRSQTVSSGEYDKYDQKFKGSTLDVSRSQTVSSGEYDKYDQNFKECLSKAEAELKAQEVENNNMFPIRYENEASDPRAWELFKICTKKAVPAFAEIEGLPGGVAISPSTKAYLIKLTTYHAGDAFTVEEFKQKLTSCIEFKGNSQTKPGPTGAREHNLCESRDSVNCRRLCEKCLRNAATDESKVEHAMRGLVRNLQIKTTSEGTLDRMSQSVLIKKPIATQSLIEQLAHSLHHYNFREQLEQDAHVELQKIFKGEE